MRHTLPAALLLLLIPAAAFAQTPAPPPNSHNQVLSANPFGLVIKWFNVEYERKVSPAITLGGSASNYGELALSEAVMVARWYPQQKTLDGFYLGARAGALGVKSYTYDFRSYRERDVFLPGAGVELGYNWLLGPKQNISAGTGFALTRLIGGVDNSFNVPAVLPGFRLNVGIAF